MLYHPAKVPSLVLTLSLDSSRPYCGYVLYTFHVFCLFVSGGLGTEKQKDKMKEADENFSIKIENKKR